MHAAYALLLRDWRELGLCLQRQADHLVLLRSALQILAVLVQCRQNLAGMDRLHQVVAAERFAHQHAQILLARQVRHVLDAACRPAVLAEQLKVAGIRFRDQHLGADVRRLPTILDFDWLGENLVFLAGVQEQRGALQRRIGQRWHAQIVILTLDDLGDGGQLGFRKVPVNDVCRYSTCGLTHHGHTD